MAQVVHELDRVVDEILGEVVAVLDRSRRVDEVVVVRERGRVLVRLTAEEAVEAFEAATERPAIAARGEVHFVVGREVPLADRPRRVAVRDEHLGEERIRRRDAAVVSGEAGREVGDATHAVRVMVASGEQARARRRAQRGRVEVAVAQPAGGETVEDGCVEIGAEATELREADVVEHDQHDVRCVRRVRVAAPATTASTPSGSARSCPGIPPVP